MLPERCPVCGAERYRVDDQIAPRNASYTCRSTTMSLAEGFHMTSARDVALWRQLLVATGRFGQAAML